MSDGESWIGLRVSDQSGGRGEGIVTDEWEHEGRNLFRVRWESTAIGRPLDSVRGVDQLACVPSRKRGRS